MNQSSFTTLGILERRDLQAWICQHPAILGEPLLIVSTEFDSFVGSNKRLDALAIDKSGTLVVIEFKRDSEAGTAELQALRYAALVSTFTLDKLVPYFAIHLTKSEGNLIDEADARRRIADFLETQDIPELSNQPRMILCSQDFSQEVTMTALWLRSNGIDISCVKLSPYQVANEQVLIVPTKIIPLVETHEYTTSIGEKQEVQTNATSAIGRRERSITFLVRNGHLKQGDKLCLKYGFFAPHYLQEDPKFHATVTGKTGKSDAVRWDFDDQEYSLTRIVELMQQEIRPSRVVTMSGGDCWGTESESLYSMSQRFNTSLSDNNPDN